MPLHVRQEFLELIDEEPQIPEDSDAVELSDVKDEDGSIGHRRCELLIC